MREGVPIEKMHEDLRRADIIRPKRDLDSSTGDFRVVAVAGPSHRVKYTLES